MAASSWRSWLWWAALAPTLLGCQGLYGTQGLPHDPLFASKTPLAAKADLIPPIAFAYLEPAVPPNPFLLKDRPLYADKSGGSVPGTLTNRTGDQD